MSFRYRYVATNVSQIQILNTVLKMYLDTDTIVKVWIQDTLHILYMTLLRYHQYYHLQRKKAHKAASVRNDVGFLNAGTSNQYAKMADYCIKLKMCSIIMLCKCCYCLIIDNDVSLSGMYLFIVSLEKRYTYRFIVSQMLIQDTVLKMYLHVDMRYKIHFLYLRYVSRYLFFKYYPALAIYHTESYYRFALSCSSNPRSSPSPQTSYLSSSLVVVTFYDALKQSRPRRQSIRCVYARSILYCQQRKVPTGTRSYPYVHAFVDASHGNIIYAYVGLQLMTSPIPGSADV